MVIIVENTPLISLSWFFRCIGFRSLWLSVSFELVNAFPPTLLVYCNIIWFFNDGFAFGELNSLGHCLMKYPSIFSGWQRDFCVVDNFPIASIFHDIILALELISKVNSGYNFRVKVGRLKFRSFSLYHGGIIIMHVSCFSHAHWRL